MATNCEEFGPYNHRYKCANKDCRNKWIIHLTEPLPMRICGGGAKVCPSCEQQGFTIYNGSGDGLYHLYRNGAKVDVYDYNTAYNIVHTVDDVERSFFEELMEGHQPATDCFSAKELKAYVEELIGWGWVEKDRRSAPDYGNKFNDYCKEHGSEVRLVSLPSDKVNTLWFRYQSAKWSGLLCMSLDPVDFEFEDFGEVIKEPEE